MRIVVTGKTGQVASALGERGKGAGVEIIHIGQPEMDLSEGGQLVDAIGQLRPDAIISAAAYTAVDKAEAEPDLAHAINGSGARRVAEAAARLNVPIVHLSTDYVFDGSKARPISRRTRDIRLAFTEAASSRVSAP